MKKSNIRVFFLLHIMLMIYSMSGICSKMAAKEPFLSPKFILFYSLIIVLLGFYAVGWQQIIKRIDLTYITTNEPEDLDFYEGEALLPNTLAVRRLS